MWAASNSAGFAHDLSPETIYLLNRRAIAQRWGCSPVDIEKWPQYEYLIELEFMQIEQQAEKRRPKTR